MEKFILCMTGVALAGAAAAIGCAVSTKNKAAIIPEGFTVTAHTGCEGTKDNSLEAIERGYKSGADIVEFDLHFNSDGEPVLAHDYSTSDSVKLEKAFELVRKCEGLRVNVDCKTTENLTAVVALAEKYGVKDRIFYTGIEVEKVESVKAQTPEVAYYLNVAINKSKKNNENYIRSLVKLVKDNGAVGININRKGAAKKMVDIFHEEGLYVSAWTVNKVLDMHKILALGCDNITTREPTKLMEIIKSK